MKIVKPLTDEQKVALDFITNFIEVKGFPPTLQNIADGLGKSITTAQHYVSVLDLKGYIRKGKNKTRSILPTSASSPTVLKMGYIAAGAPIEEIANPQPVAVPRAFLNKPGQYYALEVRGNSMEEDAIWDGDLIVVRHQFDANPGEVVVAVTEDGVTLKALKFDDDGTPYLQPRNSQMDPIRPSRLEIKGKLVGIVHHEE